MTGKGRLWPGSDDPCPGLIQGGMGVGVSDWRLARAVAAAGQLGGGAGVALDAVLARPPECGGPGGDVRRALGELPLPGVAQRRTGETAEPALVTLGQDLSFLPELVAAAGARFSAADVIAHLPRPWPAGIPGSPPPAAVAAVSWHPRRWWGCC